MALQTDKVQARIDPDLKESAEAILAELGLTATDAIRMFYKQVKIHRGLPFDVRIPNAATRAAIREAQGILKAPAKHKSYKTADAMFRDWGLKK